MERPLVAWSRLVRCLVAALVGLATAAASAGLLETQNNPVPNDFDPYTLANWDAVPGFQVDGTGDGTPDGLDWFGIKVAHNDYFIFLLYTSSHPFAGDRQIIFLDPDLNRGTGLPGWTGNVSVGAEFVIGGASYADSSGTHLGWVGWNNVEQPTGIWSIMVAIERARLKLEVPPLERSAAIPGILAFNFVCQNHDQGGDDWYPDGGNSGFDGDFFRYQMVELSKPCPPLRFDSDLDGDVDMVDFGFFQRCFSGATVPADPLCDDE